MKMSLSAKVHLGLEIGLRFTKKEPAVWKRGRIPSSEPRLAVRNGPTRPTEETHQDAGCVILASAVEGSAGQTAPLAGNCPHMGAVTLLKGIGPSLSPRDGPLT